MVCSGYVCVCVTKLNQIFLFNKGIFIPLFIFMLKNTQEINVYWMTDNWFFIAFLSWHKYEYRYSGNWKFLNNLFSWLILQLF